MKKTTQGSILFFCILTAAIAFAGLNTGAPEITLKSGKKKNVNFPHKRHQESLKDCTICHSIFPMEQNVIEKKISEGAMKKKTVMKKCQGCHRKMAKQGIKTGPTSCSKCHTGS